MKRALNQKNNPLDKIKSYDINRLCQNRIKQSPKEAKTASGRAGKGKPHAGYSKTRTKDTGIPYPAKTEISGITALAMGIIYLS